MENILVVSNLNASYKTNPVIQNLSFELHGGELICLCGPNGSGKSTLLTAVADNGDRPLMVSGSVSANGQQISMLKNKEKAKLISYMEQSAPSAWDFPVFDFVLQGRYAYSSSGYYSKQDKDLVLQALSDLSIESLAHRTLHSLSGGEYQKVRIARALTQSAPFVFLDEPAANLDFVYEPKLLDMLKNLAHSKNLGILISIHDVNLAAEYADKMLLLPKNQTALFDSVHDIMTLENLEKTFGVPFQCKEVNYFQSLL